MGKKTREIFRKENRKLLDLVEYVLDDEEGIYQMECADPVVDLMEMLEIYIKQERVKIVKKIEKKLKRYRNAKYSTDSMTILTRRWKELKDNYLKQKEDK